MNTKIIIPALVALGLAGTAYAAEMPGGGDPLGGKVLTKAEFQAKGAQMFDQMDANKDGKLDPADRAVHESQMFDQLDTNKDGSISRAEFTAAHQRGPAGDHGKPAMAGGPSGPHDGGKPGGGHHEMGMMMLQMADANKDGAVSRDEFLAAHGKHFDMMDANHDGKLSKEERQAAREKMHAMGGKRGGGMRGDHKMGEHPMGDMPPPPAN